MDLKVWCVKQNSLVGGQSFQGKSGFAVDAETRGNGRKMTPRPELVFISHSLDLARFCEDFGGA